MVPSGYPGQFPPDMRNQAAPAGQKAQVELGSLVPVRSDVNPPANTPPAGEILGQAMEIDWKYIEEGLAEINTNFSDIMLF